jgi:LacI family repressor for deo operon, udp, cdd, tsx, nupC, and nupG
MNKFGTANIRQVAAIAGVSIATVSRALQHPEVVKAETRERVMEAVRQTNFVSNAQARTFRQQETKVVIVLVRDISNPFYLEIYKGIDEVAQEAGYRVLLSDARDEEAQVYQHIEMVRRKQADGLILMIGHFPVELADKIDQLPPVVIASEVFPGLDLPTVKVDNAEASRQAVAYLVGEGHRRIVHLAGPLPEQLALERLEGYRSGLRDAGISYNDKLVVSGDYSIAAGRLAVRQLQEMGAEFTAVFAASDQMAIGAISELRRLGRNVPADVSVIGFDDIILAEAVDPPLTTIRQPRREIGRQAMSMMIGQLTGASSASVVELRTELVLRESVRSAPQFDT